MATYALLNAFGGFQFDMVKKMIGFDPIQVKDGNFRCFWCLDSGWGEFEMCSDQLRLRGLKGTLSLIFFELPHKFGISIERVMLGEQEIRFRLEQNCLCFEEEIQIVQRQSLLVRFK